MPSAAMAPLELKSRKDVIKRYITGKVNGNTPLANPSMSPFIAPSRKKIAKRPKITTPKKLSVTAPTNFMREREPQQSIANITPDSNIGNTVKNADV